MGQRTLGGANLSELRQRYSHLVMTVLPQVPRQQQSWPICEDHCFVRVILDDVFDDIWYDHVTGRPAYEHLSASELREAIETAEQLLEEGQPLVDKLNQQSLKYRNGEA